MSRLVLLDRDGTINVEKHYLKSPHEVELIPGAAEGIRRLRAFDLSVAVITNQSGVARGYFDMSAVDRVHQRLEEMLRENGASVDGFYVCPHAPADRCSCRKPEPGLALVAADEFGADLSEAFVVGDKLSDILLAHLVGATSILVRTGHGEETSKSMASRPDYCVADLLAAAELIVTLVAPSDEGLADDRAVP